jgi:hypothetical protein
MGQKMRVSPSVVFLIAWAALGCGSRTGFDGLESRSLAESDPSSDPPSDLASDAASDVASGEPGNGNGGGYILCDRQIGPVRASSVSVGGPYPCTPPFPDCVDMGTMWECCGGPGPYNGPGGSCF